MTATAEPAADGGIPTEEVGILTDVWQAIAELAADLAEDEWKSPTTMPGWTVQDVVSHLIGIERVLEGLPSAPPRETESPHVKNPIGDLNENEVELRRAKSGAEVLGEWNELRAMRAKTLAEGDAAYFAKEMTLPTGPGTMADFIALRVLDCWVHEQDLRYALGLPGTCSGPAAELSVDRQLRAVPMVVGKRARCPDGAAVRLVLTGGVERDVICEVNGGRAAFVDEPAQPPAATVTMPAGTFIQLANGRLTLDDVDDVQIEGDTDLGTAVAGNLNVMI